MNKSEFSNVINASQEKVWQVLFTQYGDIHVHNPGMVASSYLNDAKQGELNCQRHCQFDEKFGLDETITEVDELNSFSVTVSKHNFPFIKKMHATYQLSSISNDAGEPATQVKMTSYVLFSPKFMKYLMRGQLGKGLQQHLFGLKYFIETGKTVQAADYAEIFKSYS